MGMRLEDVWSPLYVPMERPSFDPFGPLAGYSPGDSPWGDPVRSRLRDSTNPILELCIDAYYVAHSKHFHGPIEFVHHWQTVQSFLREGADVQVCDDISGGYCGHLASMFKQLPMRLEDVWSPLYVPMERPSFDPFGPLAGYSPGDSPWGDPAAVELSIEHLRLY